MQMTTIEINGMTCGHCVAAVKKALVATAGVVVSEVTIGKAIVELDPASGALAAAEAAIEDAGYDVVKGRTLQIMDAGTHPTSAPETAVSSDA